MSKISKLERMETEFLKSLSTEILFSYRDYSETKREQILRILSRKMSTRDVDFALSMYLIGCSSEEIADLIKPDDMFDISLSAQKYFANMRCYHEIKMGRKKCDLVFYDDNNIITVEIKSKNDNLTKAVEQTKQYKIWSNETYLFFDSSHRNRILNSNFETNGIGLCEYKRGDVKLLKKAKRRKIDWEKTLMLMTRKELIKLARNKRMDLNGTKKLITRRLIRKVDEKTLFDYFIQCLPAKTRIVNK